MNPPSDYANSTIAYYDAHASEFYRNTVSVDMGDMYAPFLQEIRPPAAYLMPDVGPGETPLRSNGWAIPWFRSMRRLKW
jgi:hypothetical protein